MNTRLNWRRSLLGAAGVTMLVFIPALSVSAQPGPGRDDGPRPGGPGRPDDGPRGGGPGRPDDGRRPGGERQPDEGPRSGGPDRRDGGPRFVPPVRQDDRPGPRGGGPDNLDRRLDSIEQQLKELLR